MRIRDPRVPRPRPPNQTLDRIALAIRTAPPGEFDGLTLDDFRQILAEPAATDGELHQALLDEGLELEA